MALLRADAFAKGHFVQYSRPIETSIFLYYKQDFSVSTPLSVVEEIPASYWRKNTDWKVEYIIMCMIRRTIIDLAE